MDEDDDSLLVEIRNEQAVAVFSMQLTISGAEQKMVTISSNWTEGSSNPMKKKRNHRQHEATTAMEAIEEESCESATTTINSPNHWEEKTHSTRMEKAWAPSVSNKWRPRAKGQLWYNVKVWEEEVQARMQEYLISETRPNIQSYMWKSVCQ